MKVSFEGIGQWCATFMGGVTEGHVVKVDSGGCVAGCAAGDPFCSVAVCAREDACTVQMGGFAAVGYSGAAPALGYTALTADGKGGVQSAGQTGEESGGQDSGAAASAPAGQAGRSYWVVDRDESGKTVTILL